MSGASGTKPGLAELRRRAWEVRRDILTMLEAAGSGHSGGSLSMVAVQDVFGESGELLYKYGLTYQNIREKALGLLKKRGFRS